jgi:hypothetical protein
LSLPTLKKPELQKFKIVYRPFAHIFIFHTAQGPFPITSKVLTLTKKSLESENRQLRPFEGKKSQSKNR